MEVITCVPNVITGCLTAVPSTSMSQFGHTSMKQCVEIRWSRYLNLTPMMGFWSSVVNVKIKLGMSLWLKQLHASDATVTLWSLLLKVKRWYNSSLKIKILFFNNFMCRAIDSRRQESFPFLKIGSWEGLCKNLSYRWNMKLHDQIVYSQTKSLSWWLPSSMQEFES